MSTASVAPASVRCFLLEDTGDDRVYLRRFHRGTAACPAHGYHTMKAEVVARAPRGAWTTISDDDPLFGIYPRTDPRWPAACDCGYVFAETDYWQIYRDRLWRGVHPDHGAVLVPDDEIPAGAIYRAEWLESQPDWVGPDGRSLMCMLPNGVAWLMDGPASGGGGWTRTGEAPKLTVRPSIRASRGPGSVEYHGFLTDGVLVSC